MTTMKLVLATLAGVYVGWSINQKRQERLPQTVTLHTHLDGKELSKAVMRDMRERAARQ